MSHARSAGPPRNSTPAARLNGRAPVLRKQRYAGHPVEGDWLERFPAAYVLEMQRWIENLRDGHLTGPDA